MRGVLASYLARTRLSYDKPGSMRGRNEQGVALSQGRAQRERGDCEVSGTVRVRAVLYNEIMLLQSEAAVIENLILGAFLVIPLLIVAFLFSDELWQEHRHLHEMRPMHVRPRRIDWRHPLRRSRDRL